MKKYNISDLSAGTIVTNGEDFAEVKECVHGNKFYALLATEPVVENIVYVYDFDEEHLIGCCD